MFASKKKKQEAKAIAELMNKVQNPMTHQNIVKESSFQNVESLEDDKFQINITLQKDRRLQLNIEAQIRTMLSKNDIAPEKVKIKFVEKAQSIAPNGQNIAPGAAPRGTASAQSAQRVPGVKNIIAVGSGKGGVGKSTVSVNLAFSLAQQNYKVGILDADIYGPSVGKMIGKAGKTGLEVVDDKIIPVEIDGVKLMSFAFLVEEGQAVVWRGPMLGKAIEQFLYDINWGDLDYLVIDLPPGTGDTQLSLAQLTKMDSAVIVTTPQNVALQDANRAIDMFEQLNIPVLGVVENMSEFICPHCGGSSKIFSTGGGTSLAEKTESTLLGKIPLTVPLMESAEIGVPLMASHSKLDPEKTEQIKNAFHHITTNLESVMAQLKEE